MSFLRTNYRTTGKELDALAVGGALENLAQGSSVRTGFYGGLVVGSWANAAPPTTSGIIPISAYGAMQDYFGATWVSNVWGSGFRVQPVMANVDESITVNATASCWKFVRITPSFSGSVVFISVLHGSTGSTPAAMISTETIKFQWFGFIVSTP